MGMVEYIKREAVLEWFKPYTHEDILLEPINVINDIRAIPAADVVEVVHGRWKLKSQIYRLFDDYDEDFFIECPLCGRTFYVPFELDEEIMLSYAKENYPYCNCGAKMMGGDENG